MESVRSYLYLTVALFTVLTIAHVVRAATGTEVLIGTTEVAPALSWPFAAATALLAAWAARLVRATRR